jgi:hypothetical protein
MKLIPALRLAVSLGRTVRTPAGQPALAYAPAPPYYGDYGPPRRYALALRGRDSCRDFRQQPPWYRPHHGDGDG